MARLSHDPGGTLVIILGTNVLSAITRAADEPLRCRLLAVGRRRERLDRAFLRAINDVLGGRVLPFDRNAAEVAALLAASRRQIDRTVEFRDVQIAGIAAA